MTATDVAEGSQPSPVHSANSDIVVTNTTSTTNTVPADPTATTTTTTTTTVNESSPKGGAQKEVVEPPAGRSGGGGGGGSNVPEQAIVQDDNTDSTYHLKWIQWNSGKIPIIMQSINGPCPLIATMNVLLLREKIKLPNVLEQITANQLLTYLGECIMDCVPDEIQNDENAILNFEQNIHDAIEILPKLKTGLDVNIRFTGITDFEYTPECIIFDLLRIPLYHGWLSDPDLFELQNAIGNQSYNQLVDNIITNKNSTEPEMQAKVLIAEDFLEKTASQLTLHGLYELKSRIKDNEIGILFRNNHFLTLLKRGSEIYTLVTDHGYLTEDNIIWETLDNIEGAGRFFDANFKVSEVTNRQVSEFVAIDQRRQQLVNDYLVALSLKDAEETNVAEEGGGATWQQLPPTSHREEDDFELAKRLQAEEERIYEVMMRERQQSGKVKKRSSSSSDKTTDVQKEGLGSSQSTATNLPKETYTDEQQQQQQVSSSTDQITSSSHQQQQPTPGTSSSNQQLFEQEQQAPKYLPSNLESTQQQQQQQHQHPSSSPKVDSTATTTATNVTTTTSNVITSGHQFLPPNQDQICPTIMPEHQQHLHQHHHRDRPFSSNQPQQQHHRSSSNSTNRRSKSEKCSKENNCTIS